MRHNYFENEKEEVKKEETPVVEAESKKNQHVAITTKILNIRKGPGTNYETTGKFLYQNDVVEITEVENDFGHLAKSGNWICMKYVKIVG